MIWIPRLLSFSTGFLSLSQEILWIRLVGLADYNAPQAFGFVLGLYLLGIAVGAELGKRFCRNERDLYLISGWILLAAAFVDFTAPFAFAATVEHRQWVRLAVLVPSVVLVSLLKSMIFPIAHHLGSSRSSNQVGSTVSKVYFANILGSTGGPLLTGFVLMQYFSLQQCMGLMAALTLTLGLFCFSVSGSLPRYAMALGIAALAAPFALPSIILPRIAEASYGEELGPVNHLIENRYGVIHTRPGLEGDDYVFGGNVYDGRTNTDFLTDSNKIRRAYALAALHPAPRRVLVIGLSSGPWTKVIRGFAGIDTMDVVEINPGYAQLIKQYPNLAPILSDPRIRIIYDDGRRWLKRHPTEKYDLVVMNTSFHWRAYTSLLLSQEFLELVKPHLNSGGILAYNATDSPEVLKTASTVFNYVYKLDTFVYAADHDMLQELPHARDRLAAIRLDGKPALDFTDAAVVRKVNDVLTSFESFESVERGAGRKLEAITDQNMLTEYKYGRGLFGYFFRRAP
jgi:spermidine synthase